MENIYRLSKMQIKKQENIIEMRQYQLQLGYHNKFDNCNNFTQAEQRQWSQNMNKIMNFVE